MSTPTQVQVQLLGNGTAILVSVSKTPDMNVNFVLSDEEFLKLVSELVVQSGKFPESELNRIRVHSPDVVGTA